MTTIQQLIRKPRNLTKVKIDDRILLGKPHIRGICLRVFHMSPKKPHSANRWVTQVRVSSNKVTFAFIPGEGHNLQEHSVVLLRGGRVKDLPGIRYRVVRGKYDCSGVQNRKTSRSKYGVALNKAELNLIEYNRPSSNGLGSWFLTSVCWFDSSRTMDT